MADVGDRKTQYTIEGVLVDCYGGKPVIVVKEEYLVVRETAAMRGWVHDWWVNDEKPSAVIFVEMGSPIARAAMAGSTNTHWMDGFYRRFAEIWEKNSAYVIGQKGMADIEETAGDRALAESLARGATMDPNTGVIHGFDD